MERDWVLTLWQHWICPFLKGWYYPIENVKTAVSIRKALSEQAEDLARKLKVSRIGLFALVLEDHIRRQQNQELLARINAAYTDEPDSAEHTLRRKARRTHRRIVEGKVKLNHTSPDLSPS